MQPKIDEYVWGREQILWGYDISHKYTLKVLEPKKGRIGCLSLQYHNEKSESWVVLQGKAWGLVVENGKVTTRILHPGDSQNIDVGVIHRLMGITDNVRIIEASTPDLYAADKSVIKDVVRLHCVHGRSCAKSRSAQEEEIVKASIALTERAIQQIERGEI